MNYNNYEVCDYISYFVFRHVSNLFPFFGNTDLNQECLIKHNSYFPIFSFNNKGICYYKPTTVLPSYTLSNSIKKIEEQLLVGSSRVFSLSVKEEEFTVSQFFIGHKNKPVLMLCLDKNKLVPLYEKGISSIKKFDKITGKFYLEGLTLFIDKSFTENDASKSIYRRLQKNFIPTLIENDVKVSVVTEDYLERNVFNSSVKVLTPLEKTKYVGELIEKIKEKVSQNENIEMPF